MTDDPLPESPEIHPDTESGDQSEPLSNQIEDPIGDTTDGEARASLDEESEDEQGSVEEEDPEEDTPESISKPRPPAKLERLQKILAQAGIASRRRAEELIEQGRVQVNGKIVTELGTKADAGRDHIRVDGKLLQGAERHRYFVLNKPKGFVTTVKDPEGRPTVMQFFEKMRERLYPVGRLDYMSEGLLLVTNDGELANKLTRASAGVEKTYLVKVAGVPTEDELDLLRSGVAIEKGKPGEGRVRTSPARIRQVRHGDNPWYEVVLIEGRNRELRKMFEEIGHFVEKIRRVGYGPLILDQEPGNLRELDENELALLRKAADGKLRTPKAKEVRRRNLADSLPPEKPAFGHKSARPAAGAGSGSGDYRGKKSFGQERPARSARPFTDSGPAKPFTPGKPFGAKKPFAADGGNSARPARPVGETFRPGAGSAWKKPDRPARPASGSIEGTAAEARPPRGRGFGERPAAGRSFGAKPPGKPFEGRAAERRPLGDKPAGRRGDAPSRKPFGGKPAGRGFGAKPAWEKSRGADQPPFNRRAPRPEATEPFEDPGPRKPSRLRIEPVQETERSPRGEAKRSGFGRPGFSRPGFSRPPESRGASGRPFRGEGGLARPFTTSSGKPRTGGARPSSKPGKAGGKSFGSRTAATRGGSFPRPPRTFPPAAEGASDARPERRTGSGWKPKPNFGRTAKPGTGAPLKSRPGGFSKEGNKGGSFKSGGYKGKPGGSGGKRNSGGKKRG